MPQKTNLNISPYYDDFDKAKNFYKILFKPGAPVQARELSGLQSILQNQVESFGKHIFKEGSMVIPGGITYDSSYFSIKINSTHLGIDVSVYLDELINNNNGKGTRVRGQNSGILATVKNYVLPPNEGVEEITLFVKYSSSGNDKQSVGFPDGEVLILEENLTYGNTTINQNETIATLTLENAAAVGSAFGISEGVYFIRGTFVDVPTSLIVLDPYNNTPSFRIGLDIVEEIVNANEDSSLYDNAKGFTNFAAPGADRFKISVRLAKKALDDFNDTNFVELFRVDDGTTKKLQNETVYSELKKYFAKRTFDESGNYSVEPFIVNLQNSLNDEVDSEGLYTEDRLTDQGNTPSEDLMCVKLSSGRAYVKGFDVNLPATTVLDIEKPRDTKSVSAASVPFNIGSLVKVNNVQGTPFINIGGDITNVVNLFSRRKEGTNAAKGAKVGQARVYNFNISDASYVNASTQYDLYLYDIQTYTILKVTNFDSTLVKGTRIRGLSSGAIGYLAEDPAGTGVGEYALSETTGLFLKNEQIIYDEKSTATLSSIKEVINYKINDIKSIFQAAGGSGLVSDFSADTVLYDTVLSKFSTTDDITFDKIADAGGISLNSGTIPNRNFAGTGINTDTVVAYAAPGDTLPVLHRVSTIGIGGTNIEVTSTTDVPNFSEGTILASGKATGPFRVRVPKVRNLRDSGLFTRLPHRNIASLNTSNSNLIISTQVTGESSSNGSIEIITEKALSRESGVTTAFFEPFDAEKYSIHYNNGAIEPLTSDQVSITNGGANLKIDGLTRNSTLTLNVTLKKLGITSKAKNYTRSNQLEITRTVGVSTNGALTQNSSYGTRVEDQEISLNVPDVNKIIAIYESKNAVKPVLDTLKFVSGLSLDTNSIIGEQILGKNSRAVAQIVERSTAEVKVVNLNANTFIEGEDVIFKESSIETVLQEKVNGNFVDRTQNYELNKGHKQQYCDYSRIERKKNSAIPSKRLLIIFDSYKVPAANKGDLFSVNSYTTDRFSKDIPFISRVRSTDVLDFRPRVAEFNTSTNGSPFSFNNRTFEDTNPFVVTQDESSILGYNYYLPRIDKLVINEFEQVKLVKGESSDNPAPPVEIGNSMEIAQISLPPYLYDVVKQPNIRMFDNRRFTMRDIAALEKRIENLETMTSLSALELDTKTFQVKDKDGLNRFKTGFVVNNFKDRSFINFHPERGSRCEVDIVNRELVSAVDFWSINAELGVDPAIDVDAADLNSNLKLLDPNCKKTGDLITLDYEEIDWIEQPQASFVENVNVFEVVAFAGAIILDPPSDNWSRTIYIDNFRVESTGAKWIEQTNIVSDKTSVDVDVSVSEIELETDLCEFEYNHRERRTTTTTTTTQKIEKSFTNVLTGPSKEYDYVESVKIDSEADPFMRSRNVMFAANGLKADTRHFHYLDSQTIDIIPKLVEIEMISGSFSIFENAKIELITNSEDPQIGYVRIQAPNHKFGDSGRPEVGAGLGSPNLTEEKYQVDPYDRSRPAPSDSYSATSRLLNIDVTSLANNEDYFGYVVKGAIITGEKSGAQATVTNIDLISDNWGDLLGSFFFRNANAKPKPPNVFRTGTKTFRITAASEGTIPLPGSTALASDATGTFTGSGVIITQTTNTVGVRNPPPPPQRPNEITTIINTKKDTDTQFIEAPRRDPLAQTFTTDETGAFLTSFDVFFGAKDPNKKLFVELRTVELGTPTNLLVQDFAQVSLNPDQINVSNDASVATTIKFPSPIYLEPNREYALVFLSPSSDLYEMWCARMGEKSVKTTVLPNVDDVQIGKQYIGGSLFKSQNGTIWTASQYEDLTFKLRKASFVESGTVTFYNTPIKPGNGNTRQLPQNPLRSLPRKLRVPVTGADCTDGNFPIGRKVSQTDTSGTLVADQNVAITGIVEAQGGAVSGIEVIAKGSDYLFVNNSGANLNNMQTISKTGLGEGLQVDVTLTSDSTTGATGSGKIESLSVTSGSAGSGYVVGDIIDIDPTDNTYTKGSGVRAIVTSIVSPFTHLYLTDVQGEKFVQSTNRRLVEYGSNNDTPAKKSNASLSGDSTVTSPKFTGNVFEVTQFNHAHHSNNNKVRVTNIKPDTVKVQTTSLITPESTSVDVPDLAPFKSFNGITTESGIAIIGSEIVSYEIGSGKLTLTRGLFDTTIVSHQIGSDIQVYEASGVSLVGINTDFIVSSFDDTFDTYNLSVNMANVDSNRVEDQLLCFTNEKAFGGSNSAISQNQQYCSLSPQFNVITPGKSTRVQSSIRTVSGQSAGGNEASFVDKGFDATTLNETTFFDSPRLVASKINEAEYLTDIPKNKSLTLNINMSSTDSNLSPVLDVKNATFILGRNKIDNPIGVNDYATDGRTFQLSGDPHSSIFVSRPVTLENPATSLKVLVGASVLPESDFRVFYRLFSFDSSEVSQTYRAFPGFKNMDDLDGDGFGDKIIDPAQNDGRADSFVRKNSVNEFSEYQFSIDDLEPFDGFAIKIVMISTNECVNVRLKDFRAIALA